MKLLFKITLIVFTLLVCASSTVNFNELFSIAKKLKNEQMLLNIAEAGNAEAADELFTLATESENGRVWLLKLADLQHSPSALHLAQTTQNKGEQMGFFAIAAQAEDPKALFELSLLTNDTKQALSFLSRAAEQEYVPAIILYAKRLYERPKSNDLAIWLEKGAAHDPNIGLRYAKYLFKNGNEDAAMKAFSHAAENGSKSAGEFIQTINTMPPKKLQSVSVDQAFSPECLQTIKMLAIDIDTAVQAKQMHQQFKNDERMHKLGICMAEPTWLSAGQLNCQYEQSVDRQRCQLSSLKSHFNDADIDNLVLVLDSGKAYAQQGVIYLDRYDAYSVFVHELSHTVGFMDEYRLSSQLAEQYCVQGSTANVIFGDLDSPQAQEKIALWQSMLDELNAELFQQQEEDFEPLTLAFTPARTCKNLDVPAYKPSGEITFLEHHDTENIPELYLSIWRYQLEQGLIQTFLN